MAKMFQLSIVNDIFTEISSVISGWISILADMFQQVVEIFWTSPTEGAGGGLTFIGILTIVSLGIGLVSMGFSYIQRLVKLRG